MEVKPSGMKKLASPQRAKILKTAKGELKIENER